MNQQNYRLRLEMLYQWYMQAAFSHERAAKAARERGDHEAAEMHFRMDVLASRRANTILQNYCVQAYYPPMVKGQDPRN